jgi:glycosyltransferase involved in cell wall biosynthesis
VTSVIPAPRPRIAAFFGLGMIGTMPGVQDALLMLAESRFRVDLFMRGDESYPPPDFGDAPVSVTSDKPGIFDLGPTTHPRWMRGSSPKPYLWAVRRGYHPLWRLLEFRRELRRAHRALPYHCLIALDSQALVDCARYGRDLEVPVVFWSLELIFRSELSTRRERRFKQREVRLSREAALVIVQDPWRGAALIEENELNAARVVCVPNAPRGRARRRRGDHLRRTLGIHPDRTIVLYSGALAPWAASLDLVNAAREWPERFVLVVQSRTSLEGSRWDYFRRVRDAADPKHVCLVSEPVSSAQFQDVVDSADIGVALYDAKASGPHGPIGRNMELIGYSSGKVANYLHSGLPIVTSDLVGLRDLVQDFGCGRCVRAAGEVRKALDEVMTDYDGFSVRACSAFDERLELGRQFAPVLARIIGLRSARAPR